MTRDEFKWTDLCRVEVPRGVFPEGTRIEILRHVKAERPGPCLFDFDGTLSLIRSGWVEVMVPMMVEILLELRTGESREELETLVREFVARLTGKQTIYQMIELARQVRERGGVPLDPLRYKRIYLDRLWEVIKDRVEGLRSGRIKPEEMLVPGSLQLLDALMERGFTIYIASGTDEEYVLSEAELLGLDRYAPGRIYGALDDYKSYSKRDVIRRIIAEHKIGEGELLGFGDGYVEIEDVKAADGIAVGVATAEPECATVDEWKRRRLILAGADMIIPNYLECETLLRLLL